MKERSYVYSKKDKIIHLAKDGKLKEIMHAKSCSDLYSGFQVFCVVFCVYRKKIAPLQTIRTMSVHRYMRSVWA
ncbi:hypothetical protein HN51_007839 [Arachis hypogaea]